MPEGQHTHWLRYTSRILTKQKGEVLQLICDDDGIIFHEVVIKERE